MNSEERLTLIETELRRLNEVINDKQMQINSLKAEFERLNNVMKIINKRITKLQEVKE